MIMLYSGELGHESDQKNLQRCLRNQLKSSSEAAIILEQTRSLQGIPKTVKELKMEKGKVDITDFIVYFINLAGVGETVLLHSLPLPHIQCNRHRLRHPHPHKVAPDFFLPYLHPRRYMRELSVPFLGPLTNSTGEDAFPYVEPCERDYYGIGEDYTLC